jgi:hypothetical protein
MAQRTCEPASGQGEHGLDAGFPLAAFSVVVGPGRGAGFQRRKPGEVEDPQEPAVVTPGPVVVAGDPAGVPRGRGESGDAGEPVRGFKDGEVPACGTEELGGEDGAEAGHAQQGRGVPMFGQASCQRTKDYVAKRTAEGKSKREIMRRLKRYAAREIYRQITNPQSAPDNPDLRQLRTTLDCTVRQPRSNLAYGPPRFHSWNEARSATMTSPQSTASG